MTQRLRIFTALELPAAALSQLGALQSRLKAESPREAVRWVRPEGIHLTLQFYGETELTVIETLKVKLAEAAQTAAPLSFSFAEVGTFPNAMRPRVVWVGLAGALAELKHLHRQVEAAGRAVGFEPEKRAFAPHLTLGRVNQPLRPQEHGRLANALQTVAVPAGAPFTCAHLSLMHSQLQRGGSVYAQLWAAPLSRSVA